MAARPRSTARSSGIDPATGQGAPGNPFASSGDANARRIVAYGMRNPFRIGFRPGTSELRVGDVGWSTWEEVDRITTTASATNFGWPCYEGNARQGGYELEQQPQPVHVPVRAGRRRREGPALRLRPRRRGGRRERRPPDRERLRDQRDRFSPRRTTRRSTRSRCSSRTTAAAAPWT
ncbi:PQQ-dependent sugar dehydrogenase [Yinghuangia aomiensis]